MRAKYQCGSQPFPKIENKSNSTNIWKAISHAWRIVEPNIEWAIKDGHNVRFLRDKWIPGVGSLDNLVSHAIHAHEMEFPVSFYRSHDGWNWSMISQIVPEFLCDKITLVKAPSDGHPDFINWKHENDGQFSIKSAYSLRYPDVS